MRWDIFTSPSVNQGEKLITGPEVERERGGGRGEGGDDVVDGTTIEAPACPNCFPTCQLEGMTGELCKSFILEEAPDLSRVQVFLEFSMLTRDYRLDRVRIFVNNIGIVIGNTRQG